MSVIEAVRHEVNGVAEGEPFALARLLALGPRAAVDQALTRLTRDGTVTRVRRGVYMRPRVSRIVGLVPPEPAAVIAAVAEGTGETIAPHGAELARQLGLTTQVPMTFVYRTNGKSRTLNVGRHIVQLRHTSNRQLALAGTPAGEALAALRYLGKEVVDESTLEHVLARIGTEQFAILRRGAGVVPAWLGDIIWHFEQRRTVEENA